MSLKEQIKKVAKSNPYGFTLNIKTMELVKFGIVGAYIETQNSFGDEGLQNVINHAKENNNIVGGWLEDGKYYFDSCKVFKLSEINEALKFGKENEQIAIFNLTKLETIRLD